MLCSKSNLFEMTSEDYIATLNQLILEARKLLGTADKCDECGEMVPYVIGCPDGTDVCRECFDAGQH
jgi:formylmethanofuran dehydrogenase subunit E